MNRKEALQVAAEIESLGYILYGERVAVIRDEGEKVTAGGIHIPEGSERKPLTGIVAMIGLAVQYDQKTHGADSRYRDLSIGDWLTFSKYGGVVHEVPRANGEKVYLEVMHGSDVYIGSKGHES